MEELASGLMVKVSFIEEEVDLERVHFWSVLYQVSLYFCAILSDNYQFLCIDRDY